jgi:hypothetical protein
VFLPRWSEIQRLLWLSYRETGFPIILVSSKLGAFRPLKFESSLVIAWDYFFRPALRGLRSFFWRL